MGAPKGNRFWLQRSTHGRKPKFENSDDLWDACCQYFEWAEDNPLEESVVYQGEVMDKTLPKMRAMTLTGMRIYIDIGHETWSRYKQIDDFKEVVKKVDEIIRTQKFEGASAGMLNPNIIARDLGLTDNKSITGGEGEKLFPDVIKVVYE